MLNAVEELKKYRKIDIEGENIDDDNIEWAGFPDVMEQNRQFIEEIGKLSRNQFKAVQQIDVFSEEITELLQEKMGLLQEKMDKSEILEKALSDKDDLMDTLKTRIQYVSTDKQHMLMTVIKLVDIFETAADFISRSGDEAWVGQIKRVMEGIEGLMSETGINEINVYAFNDNFHEAVDVVYDESKGYREIVKIEKKGYTYRGKVLRKAKVVVNNARKEEESYGQDYRN